ncbi:DUF4350 domain-containing protein, partial [Rhizobium johnstonii]|uniref:DUF4350 domain-containing protein n=1 Tax=Rhizobium johnstonii TaxID=3019933 RepID=UPI003F9CAE20
VSDPHGYLDTDQLDRLQVAAKNLVVALPDFTMLSVLAPGVSSGGVPRAESAAARCDVPAAVRAGSISTGDTTLSAAPTWTTCFPSGESYSLLQRTVDGSTTTLLADGAVLQNSTITQREARRPRGCST